MNASTLPILIIMVAILLLTLGFYLTRSAIQDYQQQLVPRKKSYRDIAAGVAVGLIGALAILLLELLHSGVIQPVTLQ